MIIEGRAVIVPGDDVNTDVLYPGPYLNIDDPERMKDFLFEGLDPSLRDRLGGPTVLVVGRNFGGGSSREHVPLAMKAWGIGAVVGHVDAESVGQGAEVLEDVLYPFLIVHDQNVERIAPLFGHLVEFFDVF